MYRVDSDAVIIAELFPKKTTATPHQVIDVCKKRMNAYDRLAREKES